MTRVFFTSIPKCGKNLLYSLFHALGFKRHFPAGERYAEAAYAAAFKGINYAYPPQTEPFTLADRDGFAAELALMPERSVFHRHLPPEAGFRAALRQAAFRPLLVVRDPRDALLSAANYALNQGKPAQIVERLGDRGLDDILRFLLKGEEGTAPFLDQFAVFHPWTTWDEVMTVRFEDLIGARGGGSDQTQQETLIRLLEHVGADPGQTAAAAEQVFNPRAGTFFKGQIGGHRQYIRGDIARLFEERFGDTLAQWGYR